VDGFYLGNQVVHGENGTSKEKLRGGSNIQWKYGVSDKNGNMEIFISDSFSGIRDIEISR